MLFFFFFFFLLRGQISNSWVMVRTVKPQFLKYVICFHVINLFAVTSTAYSYLYVKGVLSIKQDC